MAAMAFAALPALAGSAEVTQAWMREPPPGASVAALYMQVHNSGGAALHLTGVRVAGADSASIHESVERDGMMSMHEVPDLVVAPGATVSLAPGGYHVMVFGLGVAPRAGDQLAFCLLTSNAGELCTRAMVKRSGD